ncbi:tetratricopeptide repeat protein [Spirosoma sp. HMF4905]|uniref:Tetratricopeptide repeat protein n=1 Tax=Spirosoma arboris TaxID=2682092 RepID=A0A7K1S426_9BACT|nr:tetratricopeptide repeat protein [Spirosoma arboris]MVM28560.1 tetratricopeptide repeat protein [Spirosoma arboris]
MSKLKDDNQPKNQSPRRIIVFKVISIFISVLLLCFIEIALRIFNYGYDVSLFVEYPDDKRFFVLNPNASKRYFTNQKIATTGNVELFKKVKDKNTTRIFVLGESTTIGYPYFHNGSFHRWLQYRLTHTFPDRNFEIINIALTAVNSYTTFGFAKEVVDYEPDAVLIYTGHNEYYGALGVGSTEKIGGNPQLVNLILRLRQLRMVQLMTNAYEKLQSLVGPNKASSGGTRMKLMVADQQIPYQSELYKRGIEQFRSNMDATLELLTKRDIPVFVSNLVSNEKDLKPFVSFPVDSLKFPRFKPNYALGLAALNRKNTAEAYRYLKAANQVYSAHALCNYYLGQLAYQQGDFKQAQRYFSKARDLDGLRFRAPAELNTIINQLCRTHKNAHLVDTKAVFEANSAHRIIGDELILEHVHPDLRGYALLSDAFYEAMKKERLITVPPPTEMSLTQLLQAMPITKVDSLAGLYKVTNLKRNWPFSEVMAATPFTVKTVEEKLAYDLTFKQLPWSDAMSKAYDYHISIHDLRQAKKITEALTLEYPTDAPYYEKAAMLSGELNDNANAAFYFKKAFALAPSFDKARYLFVLYLRQDRPVEAMPYLDYAIQNNTSQFNLSPVKASAEQVIDLQQAYARDSSNVFILNQIARAYFRMDNKDGASKYLHKVLTVDATNKDALVLMSRIH